MKRIVTADSGAILLLGLLMFSMTIREILKLIAAVIAHEFGHVLALALLEVPIYGFHFSLTGPTIRCGTAGSSAQQAAVSLSGPAFGILLYFLLCRYDPICAQISLFLSIVNLIPIIPLDGGMAAASMISEKIVFTSGVIIAVAVLLYGLYLLAIGQGTGLMIFGGCLLILTCQSYRHDVK